MKSASSRSEKQASASRQFTSMQSKTDWERLKGDEAVANPEHPETVVKHIVRGMVGLGLAPLPSKTSISLRVDQDVLEWFKEKIFAAAQSGDLPLPLISWSLSGRL